MVKALFAFATGIFFRRIEQLAARYKKAQMYAKTVSGGRREKRARDELDRLLGGI